MTFHPTTAAESSDVAAELVRQRLSAALRTAGAEGIIPTPLEVLERSAGIGEVIDIREFNAVQRDAHRRRRTPGKALRRFVGAIFFKPRVVLVDTSKPEPMRRWTEAHEIAHKLLPWHEQNSYLDDDESLAPHTKVQQEREANLGAAQILFQGKPFWDRCLDYQQGISVPVALAGDFAASITATLRYFVETHPDRMALVCASRYVQNGARRITYSVESPTFLAQHGPARDFFGGDTISVVGSGANSSVADAMRTASADREVGYGELVSRDKGGAPVRFDVETFFNGYSMFVLLKPHRKVAFGRRLAVQV